MIQLNLSKEQAEKLLVQAPDTPGLRDQYELAKRTGFPKLQHMKFFMSDTNACGVVRADNVVRAINAYAAPHTADCKVLTTPSDLDSMTTAVIQRQRELRLAAFIEKAIAKGIKVIYDLDDDLFHVPEEFSHVHDLYSDPKTKDAIRAIMRVCSEISVASPYLAGVVREEIGDDIPITVVPNAVDTGVWFPTMPAVQNPVVIGWMASGTHAYDCEVLDEVFPQVVREVGASNILLEVIGNVPSRLIDKWEVPYRMIPWTPHHKLPDVMSRWSIGIAPLRESEFNNSKSNIKALQYWALGLPVVCSDCPVYSDTVVSAEDGFLAKTPKEWVESLISLVNCVDLRSLLGHNGYTKVVENFDFKDRAWDWVALATQ